MRGLILLVFVAASLFGAQTAFAASVQVTVNNRDITDTQISARAALMRLERRGSTGSERLKLATKELVDEQLQLQEAERVGISVSTADVNQAYLGIARNLKLSLDKLNAALLSGGVNPQTLKDRLKANIAWQRVAQTVLSAKVQISDLDLEQKANAQLLGASTTFDYILKEVRFIIPQGSKVSSSKRTAEANQFRKSFQSCDTAVDLSLAYTDVAVIDVGRRHATQLPDAMAAELAALNVGQLSKPRVAEGGVSMLAVCAKTEARDTTFVKDQLRQEAGSQQFQSVAETYLETLRNRAAIFYK